ncbi:hypothetical protein [Pseudarthrobacter sulfonivorans]|uniref:hypothetical protein n=1 Tax=Pseudarthrobacter sulfonivorans TaxID=121292 RepID=UPI002106E37B|nr:hypothetical protein [Pseudarthrobacter sulfonivorans]
MNYITLLAHIARINPAIWDAIHPHGPLIRQRYDAVALNPQPLPPKENGERLQLEAGFMARELVRLAVEADLRGDDPIRMVREVIDDWCGTPWPRKWPFPWPGPGPGPTDGPQPEPWQINAGRVVGATVFASYASRLGEGPLREALADGAERLAQAAVGG